MISGQVLFFFIFFFFHWNLRGFFCTFVLLYFCVLQGMGGSTHGARSPLSVQMQSLQSTVKSTPWRSTVLFPQLNLYRMKSQKQRNFRSFSPQFDQILALFCTFFDVLSHLRLYFPQGTIMRMYFTCPYFPSAVLTKVQLQNPAQIPSRELEFPQ